MRGYVAKRFGGWISHYSSLLIPPLLPPPLLTPPPFSLPISLPSPSPPPVLPLYDKCLLEFRSVSMDERLC
jgi:hypothetical protein